MIRRAVIASVVVLFAATIGPANKSAAQLSPLTVFYTAPMMIRPLAPHDLFAQRLGFKVILDIAAMKIPFAATVLMSARDTVARKQPELAKFMRAYAERYTLS